MTAQVRFTDIYITMETYHATQQHFNNGTPPDG